MYHNVGYSFKFTSFSPFIEISQLNDSGFWSRLLPYFMLSLGLPDFQRHLSGQGFKFLELHYVHQHILKTATDCYSNVWNSRCPRRFERPPAVRVPRRSCAAQPPAVHDWPCQSQSYPNTASKRFKSSILTMIKQRSHTHTQTHCGVIVGVFCE